MLPKAAAGGSGVPEAPAAADGRPTGELARRTRGEGGDGCRGTAPWPGMPSRGRGGGIRTPALRHSGTPEVGHNRLLEDTPPSTLTHVLRLPVVSAPLTIGGGWCLPAMSSCEVRECGSAGVRESSRRVPAGPRWSLTPRTRPGLHRRPAFARARPARATTCPLSARERRKPLRSKRLPPACWMASRGACAVHSINLQPAWTPQARLLVHAPTVCAYVACGRPCWLQVGLICRYRGFRIR